ncbi:MAG: prepilin-type N-terminal cleavage/methylation domain-containing protein [Proteobacteria bacterium]|nr:prepilin-type N-terminal cleavage/methylation domain-containing protein [Pseudomonadota bacterium]
MRRRPFPSVQLRGFSLIELVVTIVIISALAVFAMGRFSDEDIFSARGYYDELVSATRFAQRYAVASGCNVRIQINATSYALTMQNAACGAGATVQGPTGEVFAGAAPAGVTVTGDTGAYDFDASGVTAGGGTLQVQGGGSIHSFTITADSGFVNQ